MSADPGRVVVNHNQISGIFRLGRRFSDHESHALTHHPHTVDCQRVEIRQNEISATPAFHRWPDVRDRSPTRVGVVPSGKNSDYTFRCQRSGRVYPGNIGMGMR